MRGRSHDWTECPFAHPGEKARRRDPRRIHYSGAPCPDFRKGSCRRGDACEFAHGVFECWLHPARYRTQACKDGRNCKRRVCFFAHSPEQLRILPSSPSLTHTHTDRADGSPVGSHGSPPSQHNSGSETPTSPDPMASAGSTTSRFLTTDVVYMANASAQYNCKKGYPSAGMVAFPLSANLASSHTYTPPNSQHEVSVHLNSLNAASPLRRAMAQKFLAGKNYGGANLSLNSPASSLTEYSSLIDIHRHMCASPQPHHGGGNGKLGDGKVSERHLPLGSFEFSQGFESPCYSHGFASPTSTLAGSTFSPPPLSPPLSPLSSPNPTGRQCKGSFTNPGDSLPSFYIDETEYCRSISEPSIRTYSMDCLEDIAFQLQQLQLPETFEPTGFVPQNPLGSRLGMLDGMSLLSPSRIPFLGHVADGLSCTSKQLMQSPLNQIPSKQYAGDFLQLEDISACENAAKIYGDESFPDNPTPDFGWVSELVK